MNILFIFIFFSFGGYGFASFQTQNNYMTCIKVKDKNWMFEINFCNHTLALQKHEFSAKPTTCGGIES
jgi:hypothetical protein